MISLDKLKNTTRPAKARKRVGRGLGSKLGKTCGRGEKGAGSRSGYKRRWGKEGGNMPLFMKIPIRGFNNARFRRAYDVVNLEQLNEIFNDGEIVNIETLRDKGFISGPTHGIKLLGTGELTKKVTIFVQALSDTAREKLTQAKIAFEVGK
jgi:large subunit ribosomal protein L15